VEALLISLVSFDLSYQLEYFLKVGKEFGDFHEEALGSALLEVIY